MNFRTNPDVRTLTDILLACSVGEIVQYPTLSKAIGADIKSRFWLVRAAIKSANKEAGAVFTTVRQVGFMRMAASQAGSVGSTARGQIRRIAARSSTTMANAMQFANDLSEQNRVKIVAELSSMALLSHITKDAQHKAIPPSQAPQPVALTLSALMNHIKAG